MMTSPMNVTLSGNAIHFERGGERFAVYLHRTLRLPEDGKTHGLPPSLGSFPMKKIEDYRERVPAAWREHGGVFFPMWQREAMWLEFRNAGRPCAVKVAAGKVNAVSGEPWAEGLFGGMSKQDYLVCPPQPWLDGFNTGSGKIRQFVAMPLGLGYTVEGQVTGKEDVGGLQLYVVPPKDGLLQPPRSYFAGSSSPDVGGGAAAGGYASAGPYVKKLSGTPYGKHQAVGSMMPRGMRSGGTLRGGSSWSGGRQEPTIAGASYSADVNSSYDMAEASVNRGAEMGLAQGGEMVQKIYPDEHGLGVWMPEAAGRMFVHIVNSELYRQITGESPPPSPITAKDYTAKGYPWFEVWDAEMGDVAASGTLAGVKTVAQKDAQHGFSGQQDDSPVHEKTVPAGVVKPVGGVREGKEWG